MVIDYKSFYEVNELVHCGSKLGLLKSEKFMKYM